MTSPYSWIDEKTGARCCAIVGGGVDPSAELVFAEAAAREIFRLKAREDEALVQGFADCEALVVAMLSAMADQLEAQAQGLDERDYRYSRSWNRSDVLRQAALAVSLGQHRTDAYDPDELARAHRRAGITDQQRIAGGKARQAQLTPARRQKLAKMAAAARWKRGEEK